MWQGMQSYLLYQIQWDEAIRATFPLPLGRGNDPSSMNQCKRKRRWTKWWSFQKDKEGKSRPERDLRFLSHASFATQSKDAVLAGHHWLKHQYALAAFVSLWLQNKQAATRTTLWSQFHLAIRMPSVSCPANSDFKKLRQKLRKDEVAQILACLYHFTVRYFFCIPSISSLSA